jgi:hypothetical protein
MLIVVVVIDIVNILKIGNSKETSISKIKNNTTNTKNRVENGARMLLNGSKPHSNAEFLSIQ